MPRKKIPDEKKKQSVSLTIDTNLLEIMAEYLKDNAKNNRSKYIEKLIKEDLIKKGKKIDNIF